MHLTNLCLQTLQGRAREKRLYMTAISVEIVYTSPSPGGVKSFLMARVIVLVLRNTGV